jgi:hypothetical protein
MTLMRWQPCQEIERLQRDVNRLFDGLAKTDEGYNRPAFSPVSSRV